MDLRLIEKLAESMAGPLPGEKAQYEMAPSSRREYHRIPVTYKSASVLALLYPKDQSWHIVYIKRKQNTPDDRHAGQISLPGGKMEPADPTLEACALRETREEIGIPVENIRIIGPMSTLYVFVSDFLVHPFLGYSMETPQFVPEPSEVEHIIEVPFELMLNPQIKKRKDMMIRGMPMRQIPYFDIFGHTLWGATAMITNEIVSLLNR